MNNQKIYIAGPVTGYDYDERYDYFFQIFEAVDKVTTPQPVNPMDLNIPRWATHEHAMKICLPALCECDAILLLPGWEKSRGSQFELTVSVKIGIKIYKLGTTGGVWWNDEQIGQIEMPKL